VGALTTNPVGPLRAQTAALLLAVLSALGCFAVLFAGLIELLVDHSVPRVVYGTGAGAMVVVALLARWLRRAPLPRSTQILVATVLVALAVLHWVPWSSRKVFLRDLERVEIGMSMMQAKAVMAGYMIGTGWHTPDGEVRAENTLVFRHSDLPNYNSDWGVVRLDDTGHVYSVEFLPD
jgi:hypothetical protein